MVCVKITKIKYHTNFNFQFERMKLNIVLENVHPAVLTMHRAITKESFIYLFNKKNGTSIDALCICSK